MPRRKTQAEYEQQVAEKAPHIKVRGKYQGNRIKIEHYCTIHNVKWDITPFNFLQHPNGCRECQNQILEMHYNTKRKSDIQFRLEVEALETGIIPMAEYDGTHNAMPFMCKEGHIWSSTPHDILDGYGCPFCTGNAVLRGYNDLWTTNPEIAAMLKNPNDGYELSKGSHRKVDWICPDCGALKNTSPKQVVVYGLACSRCSDGISYPNRFIVALLSQLCVDVVIPEWSPKWIGRYRYDVYFIYNNQEYIVEMDGGIGHGELDFATNQKDEVGLERDVIKDIQAKAHNIILFRIDCKYEKGGVHHRFKYIKNSIIQSGLNALFDLSQVNWELCNKEATKSLHIMAAQQYDSGKSIKEIADDLRVHYDTVYSWLKRMSEDGLCTYKPILGNPSHQKNRKKLQVQDA